MNRGLAGILGAVGLGALVTAAYGAPFYADKARLLYYIDANGAEQAIVRAEDWGLRRGHVVENFLEVTGPIPDAPRDAAFQMEVHETTSFPEYVRRKISFEVEPGDRLWAYLLTPTGASGRRPAMLCLHPTSPHGKGMVVGLGDKENRSYAEELARRGYVTLAPDYPGFGDYRPDVYAMGYASATAKGIYNHMRALDLLQSLAEVDPERLGSIGHSLGGHNTLFLGLMDPRVKVMVTSCGFCSFETYYGGDLTGWSHKGYMPRIAEVYEKDPRQMPFDFPEVLGALAPRHVFVSAPLHDENFDVEGVRDSVRAAQPVFDLLDASGRLVAVHPDCGHDFPDAIRAQAYEFVDAALGFAPITPPR
jgi:dienelactone hydrolase